MTSQKKTRAPGAGVKADDGVMTERKQVRLDAAAEAVLLKIGAGNLSLGIREAARRLLERKDIKEFSPKQHGSRQQKG